MDDQRNFLLGRLDQLQGFFPRVEGKATALFAIELAMLGVVAFNFPLAKPVTFTGFLGGLTAVLIACSLAQLYGTLFPHLAPAPHPSLLYFRDIAGRAELNYRSEMLAINEQKLTEDLLSQIWRNSEILAIKFRRVHRAYALALAAAAPWLLFLAAVAATTGKLKFAA